MEIKHRVVLFLNKGCEERGVCVTIGERTKRAVCQK